MIANEREVRASKQALILVVEQDRHIRALERYFLEQAGYSVEFAEDGIRGLELARKLRPLVLVSEILIPGLDGLSVCRSLKSDPATRQMLVVILSVLAAEERALEAGADAFIRKPLDDSLLIDTLRRILHPLETQESR
jgi:CheY-like chemotaxis protein